MKKTIISLLSICILTSALSACSAIPDVVKQQFFSSSESESISSESTGESSTNSESSGNESTGNESSGNESSGNESTGDSNTNDNTGDDNTQTPQQPSDTSLAILQSAYALSEGASLPSTYTLTGVVSEIAQTDDGDVCLTFIVGNYTQYPMYCYWLQDADFVQVGDTITVDGQIKNHYGLIEFYKPTLVNHQSGSGTQQPSTDPSLTILQNAYALTKGASLSDTHTLTGVISNVEKTGQGDICLTFIVGNYTQYPMYCYWLQDADFLQVGDTITVKGTIKNYNDVIEFDHPILVDYQSNSGGGNNSGNTGNSDTQQPSNLITNANAGLPTGANGVYNVDFTKATYVKNVTEQYYYMDGCPTLSTTNANPAVLVVPVQFSDVKAASKGYTIDNIRKAWTGSAGTTSYYSVHDYYYTSSYGQLDLDITVLDEWFTPQYNSSYYLNATMDYYGQQFECGDQIIIDEILAYYESRMDLSKFDSDNNGIIDAIVLINTLDINADVTMQWAYRFWNIYTDSDGYYYEYDGVSANDYLWASYSFMHESYDQNGNVSYNNTSVINPYTFIHEFGHVLGADDYYDTSYSSDEGPMAGCDVMDAMPGDHNAYTKFNYGWLTSSRLVVASDTVTLTLEDFSKNGDTIIIANNWNEALGVYQEYYIVVYYRNVGLNGDDAGYFSRDGIVVYHVNASLYNSDNYNGTAYYDVYNNNTDVSDTYGTQNNLIEYVKSEAGNFTYVEGDTIPSNTTDDQGNKIAYTFTVNSLTADSATITFTKNN